MALEWCDLDSRAVATAKLVAADAVEQAGSGHPGTPISLAGAAYLLFQRHMRYDVNDPEWVGRDRFILSAGHASLLHYIQLWLSRQGLTLDDLKEFRKFGSRTPGHPEYGHTPGIEITTGPLGSGLAAAVGFAMSGRYNRGLFDPDTPAGESPFDHNVYVIAGDGCLQEGIASEACSLAGTQKLGNLILIYDDNHISIEDDTAVAFNEDVLKRFEAYGWHTQRVNWLQADGSYREDLESLDTALNAAKAETGRPSIIALRTIIGWPTPELQNTGTIHGAKLGPEHLYGLHKALGVDTPELFQVDQEAVEHAQTNAKQRSRKALSEWNSQYSKWQRSHPEQLDLLHRLQQRKLPRGWESCLPHFAPGTTIATRNASGKVIAAIGQTLPEFWGGSADLAGSNKTVITGADSFGPVETSTKAWDSNPYGRVVHYGVREHAMAAIMNGIALDGISRPFGGTFFVFADYMRGAVRLAALMNLPVTYVWTHDSIGVGEDGPTHQPIEHLTAYRAIPNLAIVRPCDGNETAQAWKTIIENDTPAGLVLSRQDLPELFREDTPYTHSQHPEIVVKSATNVHRGAYTLADCDGTPDAILLASGSEVQYALRAHLELAAENIKTRVVSVPCMEWYAYQSADYKESVLPTAVKTRISIEAGSTLPWKPLVGDHGATIGIDTFGKPGSANELYKHYGITTENIIKTTKQLIEKNQPTQN